MPKIVKEEQDELMKGVIEFIENFEKINKSENTLPPVKEEAPKDISSGDKEFDHAVKNALQKGKQRK